MEDMTRLEELQCIYWDMYKDAFGVRPRGVDTSSWIEEDFNAEFEYLNSVIDNGNKEREEHEALAAIRFESRVMSTMRMGAVDRATAIRWIHEAENTNGDDDYLCWTLGLEYGYFRKHNG